MSDDAIARGRLGAEVTALPAWIKPQLTKLTDAPPDGPEWLHEIKFDGYRCMRGWTGGAVRLLTRTGLDWTRRDQPAITEAAVTFIGGSRLARSEFAADSPLEGDGFEPSVPGEIGRVFCPFTGAANCCAGKKLGRTWV